MSWDTRIFIRDDNTQQSNTGRLICKEGRRHQSNLLKNVKAMPKGQLATLKKTKYVKTRISNVTITLYTALCSGQMSHLTKLNVKTAPLLHVVVGTYIARRQAAINIPRILLSNFLTADQLPLLLYFSFMVFLGVEKKLKSR